MKLPDVIGRYEIVEELGRGAMGSVFKARDPVVGRIVALKTIHSTALEGAQADEYRARFYREARASGVLAHPGIVPVFDVGEHQGAPFLVMEFVDGRTLADAIKKGERFTLDRVCLIGQQIAEALGYAHRQGVIHRDIKPANILLTSREVYGSERPRITDFGIAKLVASEITTTGQLLGTPSFMPPEQFTGAPVDGRADLFSLGVILYTLSTGEQPFPGETMTAVSYKVVHTEPIPPSKLNPAVAGRLETIIMKCLAKNPAERYQTGEEVAQDLATISVSAGAVAKPPLAPSAAVAVSDDTLGPVSISVNQPPSLAPKVASAPPVTSSSEVGKKPSKPVPFETVFAVVLLAIAGMAVAGVITWYLFEHALNRVHRNSASVSHPAAQPAPAIPVPQPPASQPPAQPAAVPPDSNEPQPPAELQPPAPALETSKPAATTPVATKLTAARTPAAKPSAPSPSAAVSTPAPAPTPAEPTPATIKPAPAPPPAAAAPLSSAATASHPASGVAFDPRKLNPDTNAKLKIDLEHFPFGVPYTVEMGGKVYLRGITGEKVDLDNLFVPPGVQEFRLTMRSGGQQKVSNVVSDEFKAKKRKILKVELREQAATPGSSAEPISSAQIVLSLK